MYRLCIARRVGIDLLVRRIGSMSVGKSHFCFHYALNLFEGKYVNLISLYKLNAETQRKRDVVSPQRNAKAFSETAERLRLALRPLQTASAVLCALQLLPIVSLILCASAFKKT